MFGQWACVLATIALICVLITSGAIDQTKSTILLDRDSHGKLPFNSSKNTTGKLRKTWKTIKKVPTQVTGAVIKYGYIVSMASATYLMGKAAVNSVFGKDHSKAILDAVSEVQEEKRHKLRKKNQIESMKVDEVECWVDCSIEEYLNANWFLLLPIATLAGIAFVVWHRRSLQQQQEQPNPALTFPFGNTPFPMNIPVTGEVSPLPAYNAPESKPQVSVRKRKHKDRKKSKKKSKSKKHHRKSKKKSPGSPKMGMTTFYNQLINKIE